MYIIDRWDDNEIITVRVLPDVNGDPIDPYVIADIQMHLESLTSHINLTFRFINDPQANIRIMLNRGILNMSIVGKTEIKKRPIDKPNMHLDIRNVRMGHPGYAIVHEFCHAIGCIHEHQRGDFPTPWNTDVVYGYFRQLGWPKDHTFQNILRVFKIETPFRTPSIDSHSIMTYNIPSHCTYGIISFHENYILSQDDIDCLERTYPKP